MPNNYKYATINEAPIYESVINDKGVKKLNSILMGTYVAIKRAEGNWYRVDTAGPGGWMHKDSLSDEMGLKIFFLDVGQGDGALIEIGNYRILIDAGPNNNLYNYLTKWQYKYLLTAKKTIHIDYLIVSHFDLDHYKGFIKMLADKNFTIGTICHPGILKFADSTNPYNTGLGNTVTKSGKKILTTFFSNILSTASAPPFNRDLTNLIQSLTIAKTENRIKAARRYEAGDTLIDKKIEGQNFKISVLAPFMENIEGTKGFLYWTNEGITINGHSLVLKLQFGDRTALFGGDLNSKAETYLMEKYAGTNPFQTDVNKTCHHGSSDFTEQFMQQVSPFATVISSGDNEGFSHPRADAIGCAGKYSRAKRPLVYSTELARSVNLKSNELLFGMINLRCNGKDIFMSQMREVKKDSDLWDSYKVEQ